MSAPQATTVLLTLPAQCLAQQERTMTCRTKTRWLTARPALLVSTVPSIPPSRQIVLLVATEALKEEWTKAAALCVPQETTALWGL